MRAEVVIGNNHHVLPFEGEGFQTFERDLPGKNTAGYNTTDIGTLPLETCDTMNGSWGFSASDQDFKSVTELVHYLVRAAGYDTNLLLNVGPTLKGTFQSEVIERLEAMGKWTSEFGETIYGTRGCPMAPESWGVMTRRPDTLYVHVLDASSKTLGLPGTKGMDVQRAFVFGREQDVEVTVDPDGELEITVPADAVHPIDTIIVLDLQ